MFLFCLCKDQNIVHHSLEGGRTVSHSEEHHERFKEALVGVESYFPFISGLNVHVIETPVDVKFCKVPGSAELGDEFRDEGERVSVLDGYSVQYTIVLDQPEQTILLFNEEHRGCYGRFGRLDLSGM